MLYAVVCDNTRDVMKQAHIRPIAICVFRKGDLILVGEGHDPTTQEVFYRPLGGAIEFGEYSHQAIVREIQEEIGAEITELQYLGTIENMFTYDGQTGHETVFIYKGVFRDKSIYEKTCIYGRDDGKIEGTVESFKAVWKSLADFESNKALLVPEGLLELLIGNAG